MKILILLLLIFLATPIFSSAQSLVGHYKSAEIKTWDRVKYFLKAVNNYVVGSELYLYKDSSFKKISCGNILQGKWHQDKHEIVLHVTSNEYRLESLRKAGKKPEVRTGLIHYTIEDELLTQVFKSNTGGKVLEALYKIE